MSLLLAFMSEGSYLLGHPRTKSHWIFGLPSSSRTMIEPFLLASSTLPSMIFFRQSHSSFESLRPHLSVMLPYLVRPGCFRIDPMSVPTRYSIGSDVVSAIAHSTNDACSMPLICSLKRAFV